MTEPNQSATLNQSAIRVLVVDDEAEVRDAYRQILLESEVSREMAGFHALRSRLFNKQGAGPRPRSHSVGFEPVFCDQADAAVAAVKEALAQERPFAVIFLDMRMPPGADGVWAATRIRELDPAVEIVICTAYSDTDPCEMGGIVPPEDKLSYLQKPFHPHEVRQMTIALASKWRAERRIVRLAYFDTLTGLPNREQSHTRLKGALQTARELARTLEVLVQALAPVAQCRRVVVAEALDVPRLEAGPLSHIASQSLERQTVTLVRGDRAFLVGNEEMRP